MSPQVDVSQLAVRREDRRGGRIAPKRPLFSRYLLPALLLAAVAGLVAWEARDLLVPAKEVTVMPVVASRSTVTDLVCAEKKDKKCTPKKRHKKIKARFEEREVDNLTARQIVADDGSIRLLIQWAVPDRAMELVSNGNVRLRIYVGNGWYETPSDRQVYFLWADAPLHSGSVVIPADAYRWINDILVERGEQLVVAGMYREQFQGYHNRGYIDGIRPDLEPLPPLP